ncbi:MAG: hypothetical protein AAGF59_04690 [Pseudomonadota bacterium]
MSDTEKDKKPPAKVGVAADPGVPEGRWHFAIGFSVFLILVGLGAMALVERLFAVGLISVCVGFGIALAAFGTRIGGKFMSFNVVGGGATAIALYLLLVTYQIAPVSVDKFLEGEIIQTGHLINVRGRAKSTFLTGRRTGTGDFRFIVFEDEIGDGFVRFNFDFPEDEEGSPREIFFNCIDTAHFKKAIESGTPLSLALEKVEGDVFQLFDTSAAVAIGQMNVLTCRPSESGPDISREVGFLDWLSPPAHAQANPADIRKLIRDLESADGYRRDVARDKLAGLRGAEAYRAVTGSWTIANSSYRADLGRLVAWSSAIDRQRANAVTLAEALSRPQIHYLVQLTGHGDITMRQFATEILHRLLETTGWPNGPNQARAKEIVGATLAGFGTSAPPPVRKKGAKFSQGNQLYNTVVAIRFTECNIGEAYRTPVIGSLQGFTQRHRSNRNLQRTVTEAGKVLATLNACARG